MKQNKQNKHKSKNIISTIILLIAICVFVFSLYQLIVRVLPYFEGGKEYEEIKKLYITTVNPEEPKQEQRFRVDFDSLLQDNPDTVAWIRFEEPAMINYPVVKSRDNVEYLTKTFSTNDNKLGAIFMDMHNRPDFSDPNTFIYGHNMNLGGEMFSQLNKYGDAAFCQAYPYFYIYTPDGKEHKYQVFSAAVVREDAVQYRLSYHSDEEYMQYLAACCAASYYQVEGIELNPGSKVVSLSTCTNINQEERFLVQGVWVESVDTK